MKAVSVLALFVLSLFQAIMLLADPQTLPMPPEFSSNADPSALLRSYPLGGITKQAAFSHHGKAHRTITLPNGMEGWVYEVGGTRHENIYISPDGEKRSVMETSKGSRVRTYILVFDSRGTVSDVLYKENGRHDGLTALQLQLK